MAVSNTHDLGRLYTHTMRVPRGGPLVQFDGISYEVEEPWRVGRCAVLRIWKTALVLGWWGPHRTADQMLADERLSIVDAEVSPEQIRSQFKPAPAATTPSSLLAEQWGIRKVGE